jgi:hypothetical protein
MSSRVESVPCKRRLRQIRSLGQTKPQMLSDADAWQGYLSSIATVPVTSIYLFPSSSGSRFVLRERGFHRCKHRSISWRQEVRPVREHLRALTILGILWQCESNIAKGDALEIHEEDPGSLSMRIARAGALVPTLKAARSAHEGGLESM